MTRESKEAKPELKTFGDRLRCVRKGKGLSQADFAKAIGYKTSGSVSNIEINRANVDCKTLAKIASILNVDLHWLITGEERTAKAVEVGSSMAVEVLQPYVEAYLGTVFESSARIQEEITELETNPDQKSYDGGDSKDRVVYLRKLLHRELNYYGKVVDDLRAVGIITN